MLVCSVLLKSDTNTKSEHECTDTKPQRTGGTAEVALILPSRWAPAVVAPKHASRKCRQRVRNLGRTAQTFLSEDRCSKWIHGKWWEEEKDAPDYEEILEQQAVLRECRTCTAASRNKSREPFRQGIISK